MLYYIRPRDWLSRRSAPRVLQATALLTLLFLPVSVAAQTSVRPGTTQADRAFAHSAQHPLIISRYGSIVLACRWDGGGFRYVWIVDNAVCWHLWTQEEREQNKFQLGDPDRPSPKRPPRYVSQVLSIGNPISRAPPVRRPQDFRYPPDKQVYSPDGRGLPASAGGASVASSAEIDEQQAPAEGRYLEGQAVRRDRPGAQGGSSAAVRSDRASPGTRVLSPAPQPSVTPADRGISEPQPAADADSKKSRNRGQRIP